MEIQFLNTPGDMTYSGRAAGTDAEVGVSGIEVNLSVDDEIWLVMSERRTIDYRVGGEVMNLPLSGSARAIDQFLQNCNSYAGNTGTDVSPDTLKGPTADNPMTCEAYDGVRSRNSIVPATVTFDNQTDGYRSVLWLDFDGVPQQMAALNPGESGTINTYLTHPWMVTDGPGNCLEIHMPQPAAPPSASPHPTAVSATNKRGQAACRSLTGRHRGRWYGFFAISTCKTRL